MREKASRHLLTLCGVCFGVWAWMANCVESADGEREWLVVEDTATDRSVPETLRLVCPVLPGRRISSLLAGNRDAGRKTIDAHLDHPRMECSVSRRPPNP